MTFRTITGIYPSKYKRYEGLYLAWIEPEKGEDDEKVFFDPKYIPKKYNYKLEEGDQIDDRDFYYDKKLKIDRLVEDDTPSPEEETRDDSSLFNIQTEGYGDSDTITSVTKSRPTNRNRKKEFYHPEYLAISTAVAAEGIAQTTLDAKLIDDLAPEDRAHLVQFNLDFIRNQRILIDAMIKSRGLVPSSQEQSKVA
jgi:hypothetical protein